jgi:DNA/RNA endonuclease YhcR with UshA esterase domain
MFLHQERLALLLLIAVAFVVIASHLVLASMGKHPFSAPFSASSADGELVRLSGTIEYLTTTKNGGHLIMNVNNVSVFVNNRIAADLTFYKGENVSVVGIVQSYRGNKEIVVQSSSDISVMP